MSELSCDMKIWSSSILFINKFMPSAWNVIDILYAIDDVYGFAAYVASGRNAFLRICERKAIMGWNKYASTKYCPMTLGYKNMDESLQFVYLKSCERKWGCSI